jgi:hypothetical protein
MNYQHVLGSIDISTLLAKIVKCQQTLILCYSIQLLSDTQESLLYLGDEMRYLLKFFCLSSMLILLGACTPAPGTESTGEYLDSAATTTKVKASLVDELGSSGFSVKVKTYKDNVQLSGFVNTQKIKERAGAIAQGVDGVRGVQNDIIVKIR